MLPFKDLPPTAAINKREDTRLFVPTIKLTNDQASSEALNILKQWAKQKAKAKNFVFAIRLADAVMRGDSARLYTLLVEFFPGFGIANMLGGFVQPTATPVIPALSRIRRPAEMAQPTSEVIETPPDNVDAVEAAADNFLTMFG